MRIALISDIHGNRQAFQAVLTAAAERGAERHVILGDIVGYGGDPMWCADKTMALAAGGAIVIRGNHDQGVADPSVSMNEIARAAIDWTRTQLNDEQKAFLSGLPLEVEDGERLYVHADASAPARYHYVTDSETAAAHLQACRARLSFCGHVHRPALYGLGPNGKITAFKPTSAKGIPLLAQRRWLAVMGAVGQPRDGNPAAAFGILDTDRGEIEFHRVGYDIEGAAARIRAVGLPDALASRLLRGK